MTHKIVMLQKGILFPQLRKHKEERVGCGTISVCYQHAHDGLHVRTWTALEFLRDRTFKRILTEEVEFRIAFDFMLKILIAQVCN